MQIFGRSGLGQCTVRWLPANCVFAPLGAVMEESGDKYTCSKIKLRKMEAELRMLIKTNPSKRVYFHGMLSKWQAYPGPEGVPSEGLAFSHPLPPPLIFCRAGRGWDHNPPFNHLPTSLGQALLSLRPAWLTE